MREDYTPTPADSTPGPVAVDVRESPDSAREFYDVPEVSRTSARRTRSRAARLLMAPTIAAAVLLGPEAVNVSREYQAEAFRERLAGVEAKPESKLLQTAQFSAVSELFPNKAGGYDMKAAQTVKQEAEARAVAADWQIPAEYVVDPEKVEVSPDGKTVKLEGQSYSFARVRGHEGNYYILAAKPVVESRLTEKNRVHMADTMFVGGARYEEGVDQEELVRQAYQNARKNIQKAYQFWSQSDGLVVGQVSASPQAALFANK